MTISRPTILGDREAQKRELREARELCVEIAAHPRVEAITAELAALSESD